MTIHGIASANDADERRASITSRMANTNPAGMRPVTTAIARRVATRLGVVDQASLSAHPAFVTSVPKSARVSPGDCVVDSGSRAKSIRALGVRNRTRLRPAAFEARSGERWHGKNVPRHSQRAAGIQFGAPNGRRGALGANVGSKRVARLR